ncbi:Rne/Rng family ribonuclease [Geobacter sp. FeAm09]|uniref:Rne/Rng family ribonuclease n=1 Tax=Geobacter sp. FeAm09 TaxID=2597769 RepID=UPI0011EDEE7E|nr:Rne/Rng family ribonuclease [Geobacter sp. FeAm09]QEM67213.1 Rne/Rng family ribonuclease [Geobacter sp. FeAm09]
MSDTVSKKMLINVMHPEEARVAIVHDGRLMELNIEISGKEQTKGNIYKGVVLRVEPGLQAAFVDIGRAKPGFLQMGELHPDFWRWRDDVPEDQHKRRPRIQEVLRRGQELVVQVEKDERDTKGSALTSYLSLPGRYMVIMPGSDSTGISRKVEQEGARKKLKEIVAGLNVPEGIGYIIRTEAVGRTPEELQKDLENLLELYDDIKTRAAEASGAGEIYRDSGLIIRSIRDYFSDDIDEVLVDSKDAYREAKEFFRETMPKCEKRVKLHKEKRPIFSRFQLEEQIDQIYEKRVALPSGGSLIIEPTEALVSIDVNSGKSSGERGIEDTAYKTNLEAAEEVARQLRLRDLGGLIVIDFIDMRERKHNIEVEKTLKQALKMDKARVNLGRISEFGMLEMSRQRIAKTLNDAIHLACPHCEGRGKVKSVEAMAVSFLRKVHAAAAKGTVAGVLGSLPLEVAYYLLNRKKRELTQIENDYEIEVTVKGKPSFTMNQLELETVKREKPRMEDVLASEAEAAEAPKQSEGKAERPESAQPEEKAVEGGVAEGGKKRKRRRKKKKPAGEGAPEAAAASAESAATAEHPAEAQQEAEPAHEQEEGGTPETPAKKKRKRRRRKGGKGQDGAAAETAVPTVEFEAVVPAAPVEQPPAAVEPEAAAPPKKTRRGKTSRTAPDTAAAPAVEAAAIAVPPAVAAREEPAPEKPAKPRRSSRKGKQEEAAAAAQPEVAIPEPPVAAPSEAPSAAEKPKPAKAPRTRKKSEPVPPAAEISPAEAAPGAAKPAKPRRAPAKKAATAPAEPAAEEAAAPKKRASRSRSVKKGEGDQ